MRRSSDTLDPTLRIVRTVVFAAGLAAAGSGQTAAAQGVQASATAAGGLEEVIVTAQKREQNAQDVGIAITAFTGNELTARGIINVQNLVDQTPGMNMEAPGGPANTTISIRGVGLRDIGPNAEAAVVMYRDGAYASFTPTVAMPLFDLDRVEVLKGPQGTLFGRNATGGLVHAISRRPAQEFEGYLQASGGEYGLLGFEGAVSGPLAQTVSGRLSLYSNQHDGWVENRTGPDGNELENYAARGQLLFELSDALEIHLLGYYNSYDGTVIGQDQKPLVRGPDGFEQLPTSLVEYAAFCAAPAPAGPGSPVPIPGSLTYGNCYFADDDDPFRQSFNDTAFDVSNYGFTGTVNFDVGADLVLTSITDYQDGDSEYFSDTDGTPAVLFPFRQNSGAQQFSQELRLADNEGGLRWVAGLYYLDIDVDGFSTLETETLPALGAGFTTGFDQATTSWAAFAQSEYDFTDRTTLIAGARWTRDEKEIDYDFSCSDLFGGFVCGIYSGIFAGSMQFGPPGQHLEFTDEDWSGKLELNFHASDDVMLYGSVNRGIKSGGFNAVVPAFYDSSVARFEPETLTAYELGIKADPNDWLRVNGSVFYYDYQDFQSFLVVDGFLRTINVDSEVHGADLEVAATPGEGWLLNLGVSYLDTESKNVPLPSGVGTGSFDNPISPEWTVNGLVRYEWSLPLGRIGAQVDGAYVDERTTNAVDVPVLRLDSHIRANVRLTYASPDDRWNAALWVDNVTDEEVLIQRLSLVGLLGSSASIVDKPRWWGVTIGYRW